MSADQTAPSRSKDASPRPVGFAAFLTQPTHTSSLALYPRHQNLSLMDGQNQSTAPNDQRSSDGDRHPHEATLATVSQWQRQSESTLPFHQDSRHSEIVIQSASLAPAAASTQMRAIPSVPSASTQMSASSPALVSTPGSKHQHVQVRLRLLNVGVLKWGTSSITAALFIAMFAVYAWTVFLEDKGSELYLQLTELREAERGMINMTKGLAIDAAQKTDSQYLPGRGSILPVTVAPSRSSPEEVKEERPAQSKSTHRVRGY